MSITNKLPKISCYQDNYDCYLRLLWINHTKIYAYNMLQCILVCEPRSTLLKCLFVMPVLRDERATASRKTTIYFCKTIWSRITFEARALDRQSILGVICLDFNNLSILAWSFIEFPCFLQDDGQISNTRFSTKNQCSVVKCFAMWSSVSGHQHSSWSSHIVKVGGSIGQGGVFMH